MAGLAFLLLLAQPPASACAVSDEPAYATTRERPVQVGGGALYVAARERRYLDALRGPGGEPLQYKRTGSLPMEPDGRTILDRYEVTYPGLEKPIYLYLDAYHFDDVLKAPAGFTCAVPISLPQPGPDPFLADDSLLELAVEQAGTRFAPIPLDTDGSTTHGVLFDRFRLRARAARAAADAGHPIDVKQPARELLTLGSIVVAFPQRCASDAMLTPVAIEIVAGDGPPPPRRGDLASGDALAQLLPGIALPAGAVAASFGLERPRPTDIVRITYGESPCGPANEVRLPMKYTNARPGSTPMPALPPGQPATDRPVRLQAVLDHDGVARRIVFVGGPPALAAAAIDAVRGWTAEPMRLNGAPIVTPVLLQVRFGPQ